MNAISSSPYTLKRGVHSSHSLILKRLPAREQPCALLDVGGGEGYMSAILRERGYRVTCLAGPGTLQASYPPGVTVIEADLDFDLPAFAEPFECIVCGDVIEHVRDPPRLLNWLRANLKPGGRLVASLPNSGHFYFRWHVLCGRFPAQDRGLFDRTHLHFYTWKGWQELFRDAGYAIESVEPTSIPVALALRLPEDHPIVRVAEALNYGLARLWKSLMSYQFVIVAVSA